MERYAGGCDEGKWALLVEEVEEIVCRSCESRSEISNPGIGFVLKPEKSLSLFILSTSTLLGRSSEAFCNGSSSLWVGRWLLPLYAKVKLNLSTSSSGSCILNQENRNMVQPWVIIEKQLMRWFTMVRRLLSTGLEAVYISKKQALLRYYCSYSPLLSLTF